MEDKNKFAKTANNNSRSNVTSKKISIAIDALAREFGIVNGSLKFFIRGGNPSPRVEVQNNIEFENE